MPGAPANGTQYLRPGLRLSARALQRRSCDESALRFDVYGVAAGLKSHAWAARDREMSDALHTMVGRRAVNSGTARPRIAQLLDMVCRWPSLTEERPIRDNCDHEPYQGTPSTTYDSRKRWR